MDARTKGDLAEAMVTACFIREGWKVFRPVNSNGRIDLLVDRGHGFERIQVKTAKLCNGFSYFSATSNPNGLKAVSYEGEIDYFAAYNPHLEEIYLVPIGKELEIRLYFEKTKGSNVKLADDYLIGKKSSNRPKPKANHDFLKELINDPNYTINKDGTFFTPKGQNEGNIKRGIIYISYKGIRIQLRKAVYEKYIGPLEPDSYIIHIDGNLLNCQASNLKLREHIEYDEAA